VDPGQQVEQRLVRGPARHPPAPEGLSEVRTWRGGGTKGSTTRGTRVSGSGGGGAAAVRTARRAARGIWIGAVSNFLARSGEAAAPGSGILLPYRRPRGVVHDGRAAAQADAKARAAQRPAVYVDRAHGAGTADDGERSTTPRRSPRKK